MKVQKTELPGVLIIEPDLYKDNRGFFYESYNQKTYQSNGIPAVFVQDNHSKSNKGALRGLHAQRRHAQGKLVRVLQGEVFDVAVDIRKGSPFFKKWASVTLSSDNAKQIYVPPGFAHGFLVVSETAEVEYKCTDFYYPEDELGLLWNDPDLNITWPTNSPVLSKKDAAALPLSKVNDLLPDYNEFKNRPHEPVPAK